MNHRFGPFARLELREAAQWYLADGGPAIAEQFETAIERALQLLLFMPQLGKPAYPGVRTWPLKRFPYTLVYRADGPMITVIAVAHLNRGPGYWPGR